MFNANTSLKKNSSEFKSGFAALIGRPNTGKSTLINELVGADIAISAQQAQTTRHVIRGILTDESTQLILVDTPGFHKPKTLLGQRLTELVKQTISTVDILLFCIPVNEKIGPGDKFLLQEALRIAPKSKLLGVITKIDLVKKDNLLIQINELAKLIGTDKDIIPVSAVNNSNISELLTVLRENLPSGPMVYSPDVVTDEKTEKLLSEYIREAALEKLQQELPHSLAVQIDEQVVQENGLRKIYASIILERNSQKAIVIGKKGQVLNEIGKKARKSIELYYGTKIFLSLHVKVEKNWQQDAKLLEKLGF